MIQERRLQALLLYVPESAQGLGQLTCVVVACLQATLLHVQESPQGRVPSGWGICHWL